MTGYRNLHRFAVLTSVVTFFLIIAGGLVTSTESGLSVPDWPNTYGRFMFAFPPDQMVGGILYEHSHRLIASFVGLLTLILAIWVWRREDRRWVRMLGLAAILMVIAQGVLGGLTVLFLLPTAISVSHAMLAQTFFILIASIALFTSPWWRDEHRVPQEKGVPVVLLSLAAASAVYVQLVLGALMRHTHSGLAVPDFPFAYGQIIPSLSPEAVGRYNQYLIASGIRIAADDPVTSPQIIIHMLHRIWALVVCIPVVWTSLRLRKYKQLSRLGYALTGLLIVQIALGALAVLTGKSVLMTTAHVAAGALLLVCAVLAALRAIRLWGIPADGTLSQSRLVSRSLDYLLLTKPELTGLSVLTALCGFYLGTPGPFDFWRFFHVALGTTLVGGGAGALNQFIERGYDALMKRTERRPLPAGRLHPTEGLIFGTVLSILGIVDLCLFTNMLTGLLAAVTFATYIFLYTPLKRITPYSTLIGAVPGALPPVLGWAAARNEVNLGAAVLFAIVFCWQMPHFLSLAWMYRRDYARAGFKILTVADPDGKRTSHEIVAYCIALIPVSLLPAFAGMTGVASVAGAITLGLAFLSISVMLVRHAGNSQTIMGGKFNSYSRQLFFASLVYLPSLLLLITLDKA